ncbi:nucleotidyl transferase AbiEii/AbiGii toxin family protein [Candidatus Peregrinibacteria bacterium]|nr:nucleotidyl transferase AbiEii/AbiGii toxin family protein [Candidatus Peregrinibacteria bacterium]
MVKQLKVVKRQKKFLKLLADSKLADQFYFTGGTALSLYYLKHRFSEDLDFFCEDEFEPSMISAWLKQNKEKIGYKTIDLQISFNRNIFLLRFGKEDFLKVEFTYFPFKRIEACLSKGGLKVNSLLDIGVDKLFTISQNPRGRDYYDLFFILEKLDNRIDDLRKLAKIKFDWHVDSLQLGTQLSRVGEFLDDPILMKSLDKEKLVDFFKQEASKLKGEIIE